MNQTDDQCNWLARMGRELAAILAAMGNSLVVKAVELDTVRDRKQKYATGAAE